MCVCGNHRIFWGYSAKTLLETNDFNVLLWSYIRKYFHFLLQFGTLIYLFLVRVRVRLILIFDIPSKFKLQTYFVLAEQVLVIIIFYCALILILAKHCHMMTYYWSLMINMNITTYWIYIMRMFLCCLTRQLVNLQRDDVATASVLYIQSSNMTEVVLWMQFPHSTWNTRNRLSGQPEPNSFSRGFSSVTNGPDHQALLDYQTIAAKWSIGDERHYVVRRAAFFFHSCNY